MQTREDAGSSMLEQFQGIKDSQSMCILRILVARIQLWSKNSLR